MPPATSRCLQNSNNPSVTAQCCACVKKTSHSQQKLMPFPLATCKGTLPFSNKKAKKGTLPFSPIKGSVPFILSSFHPFILFISSHVLTWRFPRTRPGNAQPPPSHPRQCAQRLAPTCCASRSWPCQPSPAKASASHSRHLAERGCATTAQ